MQSTDLVTRLYQAVDSRTAASLEPFLSPSVTFQLGNNLPVSGKEAVLQVSAGCRGRGAVDVSVVESVETP